VTRLFSNALQNEKTQLSSLYGAVAGLSELGTEVIKVFIVPRLKFISDRIEPQLQGSSISNTDKIAAGHIRAMLQSKCAPVLKTIRNPPDVVDEYKRDYGFLGLTLHQAVIKARNAPPTPVTTSQSGNNSSNSIVNAPITSNAAPAISRLTSVSQPQITSRISSSTSIATGIQRQTSQPAQQQKFVIVTQRPTTPQPTTPTTVIPPGISGAIKYPNPTNIAGINLPQNIQVQKVQSNQKIVIVNPPSGQQQTQQITNQPPSVNSRPIFIGQQDVPPPELDDLSHLA
jgi:transcription initiation factor TFIID subunit 6